MWEAFDTMNQKNYGPHYIIIGDMQDRLSLARVFLLPTTTTNSTYLHVTVTFQIDIYMKWIRSVVQ